MKPEYLGLIAATLIILTACNDKPADQAIHTEAPPEVKTPVATATDDRQALIRHMHLHAAHLEKLNTALAAGDLEAAETPAYWLSRHETIAGLPDGWALFVAGMRANARIIEETTDLTTARAAAEQLQENCQGCHTANGRDIDLSAHSGG